MLFKDLELGQCFHARNSIGGINKWQKESEVSAYSFETDIHDIKLSELLEVFPVAENGVYAVALCSSQNFPMAGLLIAKIRSEKSLREFCRLTKYDSELLRMIPRHHPAFVEIIRAFNATLSASEVCWHIVNIKTPKYKILFHDGREILISEADLITDARKY